MNRIGWKTGGAEAFRQLVRTVFGPTENDRQLLAIGVGLALEKQFKQRALVFAIDETNLLVDAFGSRRFRCDADAGGIAKNRFSELHDVRSHRGREEQRLAFRRQHRDDALHIAEETHVEHAVHFIENEKLN